MGPLLFVWEINVWNTFGERDVFQLNRVNNWLKLMTVN